MNRKKNQAAELGARERQIMDVIFSLGEASVGDVHGKIDRPPSYSAVRTMIRLLESKGLLKHRKEGNKYIYRPTQSKTAAGKKAIKHLVGTYFEGSPSDAVVALFNSQDLNCDDLDRIASLIDDARREGK